MWACGGMVDTLVLGTSAKAWEFESLHAHHKIDDNLGYRLFYYANFKETRTSKRSLLRVRRILASATVAKQPSHVLR